MLIVSVFITVPATGDLNVGLTSLHRVLIESFMYKHTLYLPPQIYKHVARQEQKRKDQLEKMKVWQAKTAEQAKSRPPAKRWIDESIIDKYLKEQADKDAKREAMDKARKANMVETFRSTLELQVRRFFMRNFCVYTWVEKIFFLHAANRWRVFFMSYIYNNLYDIFFF